MFVRLLKGPQPSNILLIILFSVLLWLKLFWTHDFESQKYFAPFLSTGSIYINGQTFLSSIILFSLIIFEAFYMVRLNFKYIFIDKRTFFPAMVYILWMTLMIGNSYFNATVIANLFILIAFEDILKTDIKKLNINALFRTGILLGLATFFYWPVILILIPFWLITIILHGLNWRGISTQILGAIVPWMFVTTYYFLSGQNEVWMELWQKLSISHELPLGKDMMSIRLYILIFLLISAMLYHFTHVIDKKIIVRKYYSGLFWFLVTITAAVLIIPSAGQAGVTLAAIPATIFLSNQYLVTKNNFFPEVNFSLLTAAAILWIVLY
ncbi:MAG: hypothetical protein C0599_00975 [Salinivirgaceae bacterium]|nr:MAG: hypothetical protein C0599_00975 [Salinivirgaceae bacterium]